MSNRQLGCQLDEVARIPIDKRLASLLIYSYSFDSNTFSRSNVVPRKCCIDRLNRPCVVAIQRFFPNGNSGSQVAIGRPQMEFIT